MTNFITKIILTVFVILHIAVWAGIMQHTISVADLAALGWHGLQFVYICTW